MQNKNNLTTQRYYFVYFLSLFLPKIGYIFHAFANRKTGMQTLNVKISIWKHTVKYYSRSLYNM